MFKRLFHFFVIVFLCSSLARSLQCMDQFGKGFQKGMREGCVINSILSNNNKDKSFLDHVFDYFCIQFLLTPFSTSSEDNQEVNSHEKIVDFRSRARFLTKLAKLAKQNDPNGSFNFKRQLDYIQQHSETELEGLKSYQGYLQTQANDPYRKSLQKMLCNGLLYGSITTALAFSGYYFTNHGFSNQELNLRLVSVGSILGIGAFFSGWYTKTRIEKHLPSHITNRKNGKIAHVQKAYTWAQQLRDHIKGTDLILES
jgi:hypothetical protein